MRVILPILIVILVLDFAGNVLAAESSGENLAWAGMPRNQGVDQETPSIKVNVSLVTADVTVVGTNAPEFQADDFVVTDNNVVQSISHFSRDRIPLAVALVIDRSSSIREYLPLLQKAAISALGRLKPEDQVALFAFDDSPLMLSGLTDNHALVADIIGNLTIGSGTGIYDAIYHVARYLRVNAPQRRRAILFVSDACHTADGRIDQDSARIEVLETAATFYAIQTPGENYTSGMRVRDPGCYDSLEMVKQLAADTGGQILDVKAMASLQEALEKAISNLRLQYTLGFSPSGPGDEGNYHKLTVKLASGDLCPECRLLARKGYYYGVATPAPTGSKTGMASKGPPTQIEMWRIRTIMNGAGTINFDLPGIPIKADALEQKDSAGKRQIKLDLHVDFSHVGFPVNGDRRACRLHIAIFSNNSRGDTLATEWRILEGLLREETYRQVLKDGWAFSMTVSAVDRQAHLRIVAFDEENQVVGSRRVIVH